LQTWPSSTSVAFLGPVGTFSYEAVGAFFGGDVALVAAASIPAVFDAVERGDADWGVVPIENSIEGGVTFTQDTLLETSLGMCGEIMLDVEQCLLSNAAEPDQIERVYSHPQGLAQCRKWLGAHLPNATLVPTASTVQAAHLVKEDAKAAAIASRLAARLAGVKVVHGALHRPCQLARVTIRRASYFRPCTNEGRSCEPCNCSTRRV
jgi:chorismate mutase/prephenate dehydratase